MSAPFTVSVGAPSGRFTVPCSPTDTVGALVAAAAARLQKKQPAAQIAALTKADGSELDADDAVGAVCASGEALLAVLAGGDGAPAATSSSEPRGVRRPALMVKRVTLAELGSGMDQQVRRCCWSCC